MATPEPVRLVVLNHNGGDEVVRCVEHLVALDWPSEQLDVVLVDNASTDGSADAVSRRLPAVRVVRLAHNGGFPANNVALRDLRGVRYVGLINNDAFVDPGFLVPLVAALDDDPSLGAASPLMVFEHQFVDVTIDVPPSRPGRGDPRSLGLKVSGLRVDGVDLWNRTQFAAGTHGAETGRSGRYEWTSHHAVVRVPVRRGEAVPNTVELAVSALEAKTATFSSGPTRAQVGVGPGTSWVTVGVGGEPYDVVNNAGSVVFADGHGGDRGFGERETGQFAEEVDLFAWCGGAVLLRPSYLADVGLFDERFFLYYEDTDLSWRGRARGWHHRFVPAARVRHLHASSTGAGSARFTHFTERNRLIMITKNAPRAMVVGVLRDYVGRTYDAARRDIGGALAQRRRPNVLPAWRRSMALLAYLVGLPATLAARRRVRRRQLVPDETLLAELVRSS